MESNMAESSGLFSDSYQVYLGEIQYGGKYGNSATIESSITSKGISYTVDFGVSS